MMRHICDGKVESRGDSRSCGRFLFEENSTEVVVRCPKCKKEHRVQKAFSVVTVQDLVTLIESTNNNQFKELYNGISK